MGRLQPLQSMARRAEDSWCIAIRDTALTGRHHNRKLLRHSLASVAALIAVAPIWAHAEVDCTPLDPRASLSTEVNTKIKASASGLVRFAKVGGSIENEVRREVENLQRNVPPDQLADIKRRTLYIFCGMVANAGDIPTQRKVDLYLQMMAMNIKAELAPSTPPKRQGKGQEEVPASPTPSVPPKSVLWVDDFPNRNYAHIQALRAKNVEVVEAATTAIARAQLDKRAFDLVITDLARFEESSTKLNENAGYELIRVARSIRVDIPIVIFIQSPQLAAEKKQQATEMGVWITASPTELQELFESRELLKPAK